MKLPNPFRGYRKSSLTNFLAIVGLLLMTGTPLPRIGYLPASPSSLAGSKITNQDCYNRGGTRTVCFTVYNASPDLEWIYRVKAVFPTQLGDWTLVCKSQDATDSQGNQVNFNCSVGNNGEVIYTDNDSDGFGEITDGSSWTFCLDVTVPAVYQGSQSIGWTLFGDGDGAPPHNLSGTTPLEECSPLTLKPKSLVVEGCNGIQQNHDFSLWNNTGSDGTFSFQYAVPSENAVINGPSSLALSAGSEESFTIQLSPNLSLDPGDQVSASFSVMGNGFVASSNITKTISQFAGWQKNADCRFSAMDGAVVWASHRDGGLWAVGGGEAGGATQRYDPATDSWTTHAPEITPAIQYPMDACYGLNAPGHEVIVLFPDTSSGVNTLHRYDITDDEWEELPLPSSFPGPRWAMDILSLLNVTGENVCYLSGGSAATGGGDVKDLWEYHPDTNTAILLGNFTYVPTGFNFHTSWFVPWIGGSGAVCVGGGIDKITGLTDDTQCYDRAAASFNPRNADLGPMPRPWWGMADGWALSKGRYQIWLAGGADQNGRLLRASAYADQTTGGFVSGPELVEALYRLEGDAWNGEFYIVQGAAEGFEPTSQNQVLARCPQQFDIFLPLLLR